jgi:hypothetical protein
VPPLEGKTDDEIRALAALADDVLSKPDTAGVFQRLVKKNNPNISMPIVELEDKTVAALSARDKRIEELEKRGQMSDAEREASNLYENLRDAGHVSTRTSFSDLVKWASENGFMTTQTGLTKAAMQRAIEQEAAEPTPSTSHQQGFELGQGDLGKAFMKDPIGTARAQAMAAMDDIRKERAKAARTH